jgi:hypothetical protein
MACATDVQVRRSRPPGPRSNGKQTRSKPGSDTKKCPPGVAGGLAPASPETPETPGRFTFDERAFPEGTAPQQPRYL